MSTYLGDPDEVNEYGFNPCPKCNKKIWVKKGGQTISHDLMECDANAFNPHKYGMVSIMDIIGAMISKEPALEQEPWMAARDLERCLMRVYPKVTYKFFWRENDIVFGAFVEEWGALALRAYYAGDGFADLDIATYLEKMYDARR